MAIIGPTPSWGSDLCFQFCIIVFLYYCFAARDRALLLNVWLLIRGFSAVTDRCKAFGVLTFDELGIGGQGRIIILNLMTFRGE
jgi:hypothetical protein